ncbi:MAG: START domain-containing protein [Bacteroidota bacterium]
MKAIFKSQFLLLLIIPFILQASGDDWELRKDKNEIQVFTKKREASNIFKYKVKTKVQASVQKVYEQVIDFNENLKYMELVDSLSFLKHRKNKRYINYIRFDMPWPVTNREMVMDMNVEILEDRIRLVSEDLPDYLEKNKEYVQIEEFHEEWTIKESRDTDKTQIIIIGWVNPGGNIPTWIVNLFSVRTPFRFISGIVEEIRKDNP